MTQKFGAQRVEEILARLRANGGRSTSGRRALVEALVESDEHVDAEALAKLVEASRGRVHAATIYRTLDALEELGIVEHVHLGHGAAVYHLTEERHQHLVCRVCDSVIEIPDEIVRPLVQSVRKRYDFRLELHHFGMLGICSACAAKQF